jgi:hypothetical protein
MAIKQPKRNERLPTIYRVADDLPLQAPISAAEIEIIEVYFGDALIAVLNNERPVMPAQATTPLTQPCHRRGPLAPSLRNVHQARER